MYFSIFNSYNIIKTIVAFIMTLCAIVGYNPVKITDPVTLPEPTEDLSAPTVFETAQEYYVYYLYFTEEEIEVLRERGWHEQQFTERIAARENVEKEVEHDGFAATLYKNKTARIHHLTEPKEIIDIPSYIDGYKVVYVSGLDVRDSGMIDKTVRKIIFPDTVELIGSDLCHDYSELREVVFGRRLFWLASGAFFGCRRLTRADLPDSIRVIEAGAFSDCYVLSKVKFGKNLKEIKDNAFTFCLFIEEVSIPSGTEKIGDGVFSGCEHISKVEIPASVNQIGNGSFKKSNNQKNRRGEAVIHGETGSYAETYAKENGFSFVAE